MEACELLTFSMLVASGGADNRVEGHVAVNLNAGTDPEAVPSTAWPPTLDSLAALDAVTTDQENYGPQELRRER